MIQWIEAAPLLEKVFFFIALPASLIMIIQTISLFLGGDAGDTGLDSDTSGLDMADAGDAPFFGETADVEVLDDLGDVPDYSVDAGLRFITMRGIITFMTVFGWSGVCFMEMGMPVPAVIAVSVLLGFGAMAGVAFLIRALMGLQSSGNISYREALGKYADVYLTIPPKGEGNGKITLALGGALSQYDAVTDDAECIKTGEVVRVTDVILESVMVVERDRT